MRWFTAEMTVATACWKMHRNTPKNQEMPGFLPGILFEKIFLKKLKKVLDMEFVVC